MPPGFPSRRSARLPRPYLGGRAQPFKCTVLTVPGGHRIQNQKIIPRCRMVPQSVLPQKNTHWGTTQRKLRLAAVPGQDIGRLAGQPLGEVHRHVVHRIKTIRERVCSVPGFPVSGSSPVECRPLPMVERCLVGQTEPSGSCSLKPKEGFERSGLGIRAK